MCDHRRAEWSVSEDFNRSWRRLMKPLAVSFLIIRLTLSRGSQLSPPGRELKRWFVSRAAIVWYFIVMGLWCDHWSAAMETTMSREQWAKMRKMFILINKTRAIIPSGYETVNENCRIAPETRIWIWNLLSRAPVSDQKMKEEELAFRDV